MGYKKRILLVLLSLLLAISLIVPAMADKSEPIIDETQTTEIQETPAETNPTVNIFGGSGANYFKQLFTDMFENTISAFLVKLVNQCYGFFDDLMQSLLQNVFYAETLVNNTNSTILSVKMIRDVYEFVYLFACLLVAVKFIFKGFQIWILWRNGDADASPRDMVMGVIEAAVCMVAFPYVYDIFVNIVCEFADVLKSLLGVQEMMSITSIPGGVIWFLLLVLVFAVLTLILWIKLMARGFELLILRLGVPLATLGLLDGDMALTKNYMQIFLKTALTAVIQTSLMALSFRVLSSSILNVLAGIAMITTAIKTPQLLQQFLIPNSGGGGGVMGKAYQASMLAGTVRKLFTKGV